jgi:hypothetical protein
MLKENGERDALLLILLAAAFGGTVTELGLKCGF